MQGVKNVRSLIGKLTLDFVFFCPSYFLLLCLSLDMNNSGGIASFDRLLACLNDLHHVCHLPDVYKRTP